MADKLIETSFDRIDEIWGIESPLYFPELFAGTCDAIGVHDGIPSIMDHKNAKKMRKREDIGDYFVQLAAYAIAHNEKYGTDITRGVIFMVARDLQCQTYIVEGDEFERAKDDFLDRVQKYLINHA